MVSHSEWIRPGELAEGVTPGVGTLDRVPGAHVSCCKTPMAIGVNNGVRPIVTHGSRFGAVGSVVGVAVPTLPLGP